MTIDDGSRSSRRAVRACGGVLFPCVLAAALAGSSAAALAGGGSSPCDAGPTWWEVDRIGEDDTLTSQNPGNGLSTLGGTPNIYHTLPAHWTQTVDAKAVEARFIVYGTQSPSDNWDPFYTWEQSFKHFHYSVFIMEGNFEDFASQSFPIPSNAPGDIIFINFGLGTEGGGPTDIEKRDEVFGCVGINCTHPTFDYRFDLSDHDIVLEAGKEYIMWLRTLGQPSVGHVRLAYSSVPDVIDFRHDEKRYRWCWLLPSASVPSGFR